MITGKFDVTIEYNTFSEYGRDMYSILLTYGGPFQSRIATNTEKKMDKKKKENELEKSNKTTKITPLHWCKRIE